jgi:hypothetical protein
MPPSYSQLELESTAWHIAAAGRLKDGDEGASKPEFWHPFLSATRVKVPRTYYSAMKSNGVSFLLLYCLLLFVVNVGTFYSSTNTNQGALQF